MFVTENDSSAVIVKHKNYNIPWRDGTLEIHVILLLLDLSAAFDTVDYNILLYRLAPLFGVTGSAFFWFGSYLSNQFFNIKGKRSLCQTIIL